MSKEVALLSSCSLFDKHFIVPVDPDVTEFLSEVQYNASSEKLQLLKISKRKGNQNIVIDRNDDLEIPLFQENKNNAISKISLFGEYLVMSYNLNGNIYFYNLQTGEHFSIENMHPVDKMCLKYPNVICLHSSETTENQYLSSFNILTKAKRLTTWNNTTGNVGKIVSLFVGEDYFVVVTDIRLYKVEYGISFAKTEHLLYASAPISGIQQRLCQCSGNRILLCGQRKIRICNIETGEFDFDISVRTPFPLTLTCLQDDYVVAATTTTLLIWDIKNGGQPILKIKNSDPITTLYMSNNMIYIGKASGNITVHNLNSNVEEFLITEDKLFSPRSGMIDTATIVFEIFTIPNTDFVITSSRKTLCIWNMKHKPQFPMKRLDMRKNESIISCFLEGESLHILVEGEGKSSFRYMESELNINNLILEGEKLIKSFRKITANNGRVRKKDRDSKILAEEIDIFKEYNEIKSKYLLMSQIFEEGTKLNRLSPRVSSFASNVAASKGATGTLHNLYMSGIDIHSSNYDKRTSLHLAAAEGRLSTTKYLVETGGMMTKDRWGRTPKDDAVFANKKKVAKFLDEV
eukprot:TRINITY_DN5863_c0_g1_i3.p1 TRINITY_DN5863_c0_g1~~TRINITY_DN5863_c0_g1_i3.p1  ORF type:complete len:623 (-),score=105.86 TRINITY_DN5863_c0_g1_i3:1174-2901(-)